MSDTEVKQTLIRWVYAQNVALAVIVGFIAYLVTPWALLGLLCLSKYDGDEDKALVDDTVL